MSRQKIIKATRAEKVEYANSKPKPKHPLKAWLIEGNSRKPIEDTSKEVYRE